MPLTEARFSFDGNLIVTTSLDGRAILWNAVGEPLRVLQHAFPVRGAEFLPKGRHFVTYGRNEAWLWGSRGFLVARLRGPAKRVSGAGYSGQADRVVTGQPAASLPVQLGDGEHPCAVQLAGHHRDDHLLLQVAQSLEEHFEWRNYRPPVWAGNT